MTESPPSVLIDYVRSSARLLELPLSDEQIERVAVHLGRTRKMAELLRDFPLQPHDEQTEIYCPAPFPGLADAASGTDAC